MKFLRKKLLIGVLCLGSAFAISDNAKAIWPFSSEPQQDDVQTCKARYEDECSNLEKTKEECKNRFSGLNSYIEKAKDDVEELKESQNSLEAIFVDLQDAYAEWQRNDYRIDTPAYTSYNVLKLKFRDQSRVVSQQEQIVREDIANLSNLLRSDSSKRYLESLNSTVESYYRYNMAVAQEDGQPNE